MSENENTKGVFLFRVITEKSDDLYLSSSVDFKLIITII